MVEAGFRCAVLTCRTVEPLEIDHIDDYAQVGKHEFSNMIVLCANCHRRKGTGSRKLDRKALRIIKYHLGLVSRRYNDVERRILEHFVSNPAVTYVVLPATEVLFGYLLKDGLLDGLPGDQADEAIHGLAADGQTFYITRAYTLTEQGKDFVRRLREHLADDPREAGLG